MGEAITQWYFFLSQLSAALGQPFAASGPHPLCPSAPIELRPGLLPDGAGAESDGARSDEPLRDLTLLWTAEAEERLRRIPIPAIRRVVIRRVEAYAREQGLRVVDLALYETGRAAER